MTQRSLQGTLDELERGRAEGLHLGGQLYVSLGGQVVADSVFGEARPGEPMRHDHLMLWLSTSKPITAVALAQLWEAGELELDDPVARHVPEFAAEGKGSITLRHLLTHTAGIRTLRVGWPEASWDETVAEICAMRPEPRWIPGERAGYHTQSSWFILGEVVQRVSGHALPELLRERIFEPLGMVDCWIGMPPARHADYGDRLAPTYDTSGATPTPIGWTSETHLTHAAPGGNGCGPLGQLGRFYEMLLGSGERQGVRLLQPPTVEALTARHRVGLFDRTFRAKLDWGLGFIVDSRHYEQEVLPYSYGPHASTRTFGHSGARSSTAFADPQHDLVVALAVNGMADAKVHRKRFDRLTAQIYEDLELRPVEADAT